MHTYDTRELCAVAASYLGLDVVGDGRRVGEVLLDLLRSQANGHKIVRRAFLGGKIKRYSAGKSRRIYVTNNCAHAYQDEHTATC
jgi:hypothetical protein